MSIANGVFEASGLFSLDDNRVFLHVIRAWRGRGWQVRRTGAARAMRILPTKAGAIQYARRYGVPVYVHGPDGMVQRVIDQ